MAKIAAGSAPLVRVGTHFLVYALLVAVAVTCLIPFYSMLVTATHTNADIARKMLFLPGGEFIHNYTRLMDTVNLWRGFGNTVYISVTSTALALYFSALGGYGFSKYNFRFKGPLMLFVLATMMLPGQLGIIGFFQLVDKMGLLNTYWPIILPSISNAFGVFFMKQFADSSVPTEIIESGRIDGCKEIAIFHRLVIPLLMPAIATLGIFSFIGNWNEFMMPMIILFENDKMPLAVMIASVRSYFFSDFGAQHVGIVISIVPVLVFFSIASKRVISGVTAGALKG